MANNRGGCDPCCNPEEVVRDPESFKWAVLQTLCDIASNESSVTANVNLVKVGGSAITIGQALMAASLPVVIASNQSSFPVTIAAGAAVIGHVIVDSGTLTAVTAITNALPAGANLLGKTGIDQTTPGTTNRVAANLDQVAGAAIAQGHGTAATAIRVELPTDGTGVVNLGAGTAVIGHVIVDSGTLTTVSTVSAVTAITNALPTGTNLMGKVGIDQTTPGTTNAVSLAQIGATTVVNGGLAGSLSVGGTVATNVAITANPLNLGAQAVSSENAAVTTARQVQLVADLVGKLIVLPYANPENFVSGAITSAMSGTTSTSLIASPGGSLRNYITQVTVSNAHATVGTDLILQDGNGGTTLYTIPAAAAYGGATISFPTPLRQPTVATALYIANVTTGASTKASASGYKGL